MSSHNNNPTNNNNPPTHPTNEEIEARLTKLRDETKGLVNQKELEERLAKLTNKSPNYYSSSEPPIKIYQMISKERGLTDDQKADHLMERMFHEMALDGAHEKSGKEIDDEIARRLALLRDQNAALQGQPAYNIDARPATARELIKQILAQPDVTEDDDHHQKMNISDEDSEEGSQDESFDWCNTCNEDAVLKCLDCDEDIYCRECFRELHLDSDMRRHRTVPYQKKSSTSRAKIGGKSNKTTKTKKRNS